MKHIELNVSDEAYASLEAMAAETGRPLAELAAEQLEEAFGPELPPLTPEQTAAVREAMDQIDRGEGIRHEQVVEEIMASSKNKFKP